MEYQCAINKLDIRRQMLLSSSASALRTIMNTYTMLEMYMLVFRRVILTGLEVLVHQRLIILISGEYFGDRKTIPS